MMEMNDFMKKNFNKFHIIGMVLGVGFSMVYWAKAGHLSDNVLKSSPYLMALWGFLVGYLTFDFIFNAKNRKEEQENEK